MVAEIMAQKEVVFLRF